VPLVTPSKKPRVIQPRPEPQPVGVGAPASNGQNGHRPPLTERFRERVSVAAVEEKSLEIPTFLRKRSQTP
jgi:hypothetical protein